jgi:motility quorum-sensing regulator / GCU-specific mRNA interferase toxin
VKRRPHYSLTGIKSTFCDVSSLRITLTGITLEQVVQIVQGIMREHFYKSMTSEADHTIWQDVYHVPYAATVLYVKFTTDSEGYLVISFKEK